MQSQSPKGYQCTESLEKAFPRLRELAPAARGGITQPRNSRTLYSHNPSVSYPWQVAQYRKNAFTELYNSTFAGFFKLTAMLGESSFYI